MDSIKFLLGFSLVFVVFRWFLLFFNRILLFFLITRHRAGPDPLIPKPTWLLSCGQLMFQTHENFQEQGEHKDDDGGGNNNTDDGLVGGSETTGKTKKNNSNKWEK